MSRVEIVPATQVSQEQIREGVLAGFSDYAVPMQPSEEAFAFMMRQRGLVPDASWVAIAEGRVVAVWLVSVAGQAAYLISSGTAPAFRGRGLARGMAARCIEGLQARGCATFQTEVLAGNAVAAGLYEKLGMRVVRRLDCYTVPQDGVADVELVAWAEVVRDAPGCRDWRPSWQNADAALTRAADDAVCVAVWDDLGLAGYAAGFAPSGAVAQIAVRPDRRRQGLGRRLVRAITASGVCRVLNVDAADVGFAGFMAACGAKLSVQQEERMLLLQE
ncbi:MAG: N-acetyltransferase family protein [Sulfitobacter sp.]